MAECAAWAACKGLTLYGLMQEIYKEYGLYREEMVYIIRKGKTGAEQIREIIAGYRQDPPKEIAGRKVISIIDYNIPEKTGFRGRLLQTAVS